MSTALAVRYGTQADKKKKTGAGDTPPTPVYTETLLWTNPNRTATFNGKDVTLSESVDSFEYLKVVYAYSTSTTDVNTFRTLIIPVWNLAHTGYMYQRVSDSSTGYPAALCLHNSENIRRARNFWILTNGTQIHFFACTNIGGSTSANTGCIPVYIYGIKQN